MTKQEIDALVNRVCTSGTAPSAAFIKNSFEDWRARSMLAKCLCHPTHNKIPEALALLESITGIEPKNAEDIEYKSWALYELSTLHRKYTQNFANALKYANQAIDLAESTTHDYHLVVRGDLWAQRWFILNIMGKTDIAIQEANLKIETHTAQLTRFTKNNSYLYNAYRFKAQVAGSQGDANTFLKLMKKALSYIRLQDEDKKRLAIPLSAKHQNIHLLLQHIDLATPRQILWTI